MFDAHILAYKIHTSLVKKDGRLCHYIFLPYRKTPCYRCHASRCCPQFDFTLPAYLSAYPR
jgi:hypothetical protein